MPGCNVFNEEYQMLLAHFFDHVTAQDLSDQAITMVSNPQLTDSTKELINFSDVKSFDPDINLEKLSEVVEINKQQHKKYPEFKTAVVAPDALSFSLALEYKGHSEAQSIPGLIKIFTSVDEAMEWLGGDKAHWAIMIDRISTMCSI